MLDLIRAQSVILQLQKLKNIDLAKDKPEKQRSYKKEISCVKIELCSAPEDRDKGVHLTGYKSHSTVMASL